MNEAIDIYAPKPGSLPWRILKHLSAPECESIAMSRREIGSTFSVDNAGSLDTLLQLACARSVLVKGRNSSGEVTWRLGYGQFVLKENRPIEETPAAPVVPTGPALAPAVTAHKWPFALGSVSAPEPTGVDIDRIHRDRDPKPARVAAASPKRARAVPRKPYIARIRKTPLVTPESVDLARTVAWLQRFQVGNSAEFSARHTDLVKAAIILADVQSQATFRVERLSRYRAGIERTA